MNKVKIIAVLFLAITIQLSAQDPLVEIMKEEVEREMNLLKYEDFPPYFIDYRINEIKSYTVSSSFGSIVSEGENFGRVLTTSVRVGDYKLDNTREVDGENPYDQGLGRMGTFQIPFENEADAIKQVLWHATENEYRAAVATYHAVQGKMNLQTRQASSVPDFSKEAPTVYIEEPITNFDSFFETEQMKNKIKKLSSIFLDDQAIFAGNVDFEFWVERKYYVNSEGANIAQNQTFANMQISGAIKADDGSVMPLLKSYFTFTPEAFPSDEVLESEIKELIIKLKKLKSAPIAEAYSGPAILSAQAAGVFFHEIFGHRIEGHRLKSDVDGQTFVGKQGESILPDNLTIISDPTLTKLGDVDLIGFYKYDDEGVKSQRVEIIKDGKLQNFLMSRNPIDGASHSNGHGRAQAGASPVTRQSNLIVNTNKPLSNKALRKKLIKECKRQDKDYGYFIKDVIGGFTSTDRYSPNVFNIHPTEVYRIYVDGRPDELVRGVELIGTPLAMFATIQNAGDDQGVFTGMCGAESGYVPVTAISPSLFVKQIETQMQPKSYERMPILTRPQATK